VDEKKERRAGQDPLAPHASTATELQDRLAAERRGVPFLVFRGSGGQELLELAESRPRVTLGRTEAADISLSWDDEVSRVHAQLDFIAGEWTITDDGLSRNGTYVNGARVSRHRLVDGDRIQIGGTVLVFKAPGLGDSRSTVARDDMASPVDLSPAQRRVLVALCRPFKVHDPYATPATNQAIADELVVSVDAVKTQLRTLFRHCDIEHLPQNQKRARLVELALTTGLVSPREL
jgi:pSer/pThr/pTyr-binding forkhead associated (FHA) protein